MIFIIAFRLGNHKTTFFFSFLNTSDYRGDVTKVGTIHCCSSCEYSSQQKRMLSRCWLNDLIKRRRRRREGGGGGKREGRRRRTLIGPLTFLKMLVCSPHLVCAQIKLSSPICRDFLPKVTFLFLSPISGFSQNFQPYWRPLGGFSPSEFQF